MAKSAPRAHRRPPHPLQTFRDAIGMKRADCARIADITAATIQNIELGKAPLQQGTAELLEASTGVNAEALLDAHEKWTRGELKQRAQLIDIRGSEFTNESYEAYQRNPITDEKRDKAIEDIKTRVDLLLGALAKRSHKFRGSYRRLIRFLNKERVRSKVNELDMVERGRLRMQVETRTMTVAQLAKEPDLTRGPQWRNSGIEKDYSPRTKVMVSIETFPYWPFADRMGNLENWVNPDCISGTRTIWRMNFPDRKQIAIHFDQMSTQGLSSKRLPAMSPDNHIGEWQVDSSNMP
jgi:transcriptional regulator with XRE-family HTH domain